MNAWDGVSFLGCFFDDALHAWLSEEKTKDFWCFAASFAGLRMSRIFCSPNKTLGKPKQQNGTNKQEVFFALLSDSRGKKIVQ